MWMTFGLTQIGFDATNDAIMISCCWNVWQHSAKPFRFRQTDGIDLCQSSVLFEFDVPKYLDGFFSHVFLLNLRSQVCLRGQILILEKNQSFCLPLFSSTKNKEKRKTNRRASKRNNGKFPVKIRWNGDQKRREKTSKCSTTSAYCESHKGRR